jgi:hypothetical protein
MDPNTSVLERAFEIAKSGCCRSLQDIRRQLSREGYVADTVTGPLLEKQLKELMSRASAAIGEESARQGRDGHVVVD